MVVAHNLLAQNANMQFNIVGKKQRKSAEKLASGFKINRAADDAAKLTISEKMRWQIRGLDQGASNISQGIDLLNVADGALGEATNILQRVRELTIQAYNDTNTKQDREAIQQEIEQSLQEIDRIGETTQYNTQPLLQGNKIKTKTIDLDALSDLTEEEKIQQYLAAQAHALKNGEVVQNPDGTYTVTGFITETKTEFKQMATWVKYDPELKVHQNYSGNQDTSGYMLQTLSDGKTYYYGPDYNDVFKDQGYIYALDDKTGIANNNTIKPTWTETIADNPSAKVDFSALKNVTSAEELYEKMSDLLGGRISFSCGTCRRITEGVVFTGSADNATVNNSNYGGSNTYLNNVNLTSYFSEIKDLINRNSSKTLPALADELAKRLRNDTLAALKRSNNSVQHFDRTIAGSDPYSLIVYDFRDESKLLNPNDANSHVYSNLNKQSAITSTIAVPVTRTYKVVRQYGSDGLLISDSQGKLTPGTGYTGQGKYTYQYEDPLHIMAGPLNTNDIKIDLPKISLTSLGLFGNLSSGNYGLFSVDRYHKVVKQSAAYQAAMEKYESEKYTETVNTVQKTGQKYVSDGLRWVNGEPEEMGHHESVTYTVTEVSRTLNPNAVAPTKTDKDEWTEYDYDPDDVAMIDRAISIISKSRSNLGAMVNRLEHAYNNNLNTSENTQASESRIRDTDMAEEMVEYSKNNIIAQAAQSMLTQANQSSQGVLSLLQ